MVSSFRCYFLVGTSKTLDHRATNGYYIVTTEHRKKLFLPRARHRENFFSRALVIEKTFSPARSSPRKLFLPPSLARKRFALRNFSRRREQPCRIHIGIRKYISIFPGIRVYIPKSWYTKISGIHTCIRSGIHTAGRRPTPPKNGVRGAG